MKKLSTTLALGLFLCLAGAGILRADDSLRRIQQSLRDQGFYYGPIDGTPGDETSHAIRRYQIRNGLAVTGDLNDETIKSINRTGAAVAGSSGNSGGKITGDSPRPSNGSSYNEDRRYAEGKAPSAPSRATPAPAPVYRPQPPSAQPNPGDDADTDADVPAPRAPGNRPDLRVAPPSAPDATTMPRNGIPPSAALTGVFERTPYEFAPPPVQADILRRAQAILLRDGFYDGEANGRPNPVTFEALTNFQGVNHLRHTGRLDAGTLSLMHLLPARPQMGAPRGPNPVYEGNIVR